MHPEDESKSRRDQAEEHDNHDRWLVSYADFITLLFAFFVVMYATSNNNQDKQKSFEDSVRSNLKLSASGKGYGSGSGSVEPETVSHESIIPLEFPVRGGPGETEQYVQRVFEKNLSSDEKDKVQELRHDAIGVRIELASAQFFLPGGVKIRTSALSSLDKIAEILRESNKKLVIEGHTDSQPVAPTANYESNWELASLRATSIVRYLVKYQQIDPKRISAVSYADTRPLASNETVEGRARNRRIEIYIILDDKLQNY